MYLYSSGYFKINKLGEIDDLGLNICFASKYLIYNTKTKKARIDIITPLKNIENEKFRCGNKYKLLLFIRKNYGRAVSVYHEPIQERWISCLQSRCHLNGICFIYGTEEGKDYYTGDFSNDKEFRLWENCMSQ